MVFERGVGERLVGSVRMFGPTATVATSASQKITATITAMLYTAGASVQAAQFTLCYRPSGSTDSPTLFTSGVAYGAVLPPVGGAYAVLAYPASGSVQPGTGSWDVGWCAYTSSTPDAITVDTVQGFVQLTE